MLVKHCAWTEARDGDGAQQAGSQGPPSPLLTTVSLSSALVLLQPHPAGLHVSQLLVRFLLGGPHLGNVLACAVATEVCLQSASRRNAKKKPVLNTSPGTADYDSDCHRT